MTLGNELCYYKQKIMAMSLFLKRDLKAIGVEEDLNKKLQTANIDTDINSKLISKVCAQLLATPWTIAHQAPLFIKFSKQDYWSGLLFPPPGHLPIPGIEPRLLCPLN